MIIKAVYNENVALSQNLHKKGATSGKAQTVLSLDGGFPTYAMYLHRKNNLIKLTHYDY